MFKSRPLRKTHLDYKFVMGIVLLMGLLQACSSSVAPASTYTVTTLVDPEGEPIPFRRPEGLAVDSEGNLYVAEALGGIWRVSRAGEASPLITADDVALPARIALDREGTLYVVESAGNRVTGLSRDGVLTVIAGSGENGYRDGPAHEAQFFLPIGIAVDASGTVYVADSGNNRIRRITTDGQVSTLAGGQPGLADGAGVDARFTGLTGLATDEAGNLYVAEATGERIRLISRDGLVSTVAGTGEEGFVDGPALEALLARPADVAVDEAGNLYVADLMNHSIRLITPDRRVTTIAGGGEEGYVDGSDSEARFRFPQAVAVGVDGTVYVADSGNGVIRIIRRSGSGSGTG